jgi:hypothetical protein
MTDKLSKKIHRLALDTDPDQFIPGGDAAVHGLADEVAALEQQAEDASGESIILADRLENEQFEWAKLRQRMKRLEMALSEFYRSKERGTISVENYRLARETAEALSQETDE